MPQSLVRVGETGVSSSDLLHLGLHLLLQVVNYVETLVTRILHQTKNILFDQLLEENITFSSGAAVACLSGWNSFACNCALIPNQIL